MRNATDDEGVAAALLWLRLRLKRGRDALCGGEGIDEGDVSTDDGPSGLVS